MFANVCKFAQMFANCLQIFLLLYSMKNDASTQIFLDTRRIKKDKTYPVKLRVTFQRKTNLYSTDLSLTKKDFALANAENPKPPFKDIKFDLMEIEQKAVKIIGKLTQFTFPVFERKFLERTYDKTDLFAKYEEYIALLEKNDQIGTASAYRCSKNSFYKFLAKYHGLQRESFPFSEVNPILLQEYENYMLNEDCSYSTIGIYLRPMRTLFNMSREEGDIPMDHYPFGKRKYQIPASTNNKRPLDGEQMKILLNTPANEFQEKARDFWFLSYLCNGINMHDIAEMKYGYNLQDEQIVFLREKTKRTNKANLKPIVVQLTDHSQRIIEKYRNADTRKGKYVFPILQPDMTAKEIKRAVSNFTRLVNQHLKTLAEKAGLGTDISTYWARHTFANTMLNNGASIEMISESVGHSNSKTTEIYLSGFKVAKKKEFANKLMDFLNEETPKKILTEPLANVTEKND